MCVFPGDHLSFDQRLLYHGGGIIDHRLGDAYPRTIVFGRGCVFYPLFHIKGPLGEDATATRLGNAADGTLTIHFVDASLNYEMV